MNIRAEFVRAFNDWFERWYDELVFNTFLRKGLVMKDFIGQEITVGSKVVGANRRGSSLWLTLGTVTRVCERRGMFWLNGQPQPRSRGDLVVVVPASAEEHTRTYSSAA